EKSGKDDRVLWSQNGVAVPRRDNEIVQAHHACNGGKHGRPGIPCGGDEEDDQEHAQGHRRFIDVAQPQSRNTRDGGDSEDRRNITRAPASKNRPIHFQVATCNVTILSIRAARAQTPKCTRAYFLLNSPAPVLNGLLRAQDLHHQENKGQRHTRPLASRASKSLLFEEGARTAPAESQSPMNCNPRLRATPRERSFDEG